MANAEGTKVDESLTGRDLQMEVVPFDMFKPEVISSIALGISLSEDGSLDLTSLVAEYDLSDNQIERINYGWNRCVEISGHVSSEDAMLHPDTKELLVSWLSGMAVISTINSEGDAVAGLDEINPRREAIGYCRLMTAASSEKLIELGVSMLDCQQPPTIMELGTVIVAQGHRCKGIGESMIGQLHMQFASQLSERQILIFGTTTTLSMLKSLKSAQASGAVYYAVNHMVLEKLASATCICGPDSVKVDGCGPSCGLHEDAICSVRTQDFSTPVSVIEVSGFRKSCVMFVSDIEFAKHLNQAIMEASDRRNMSTQDLANYWQNKYELPNNS